MAALHAITDLMGREVRPARASLTDAAKNGTRREILLALRDEIATRIDEGVPARDLAALSLRLMSIAKELEEFDAQEGDEITDAVGTPDEAFDPS